MTIVATNGERAFRLAAKDPAPDIILLDIMMPGMDGYETCARLKADEKTRDIPVIFVTAKSEVEDELKPGQHQIEQHQIDAFGEQFQSFLTGGSGGHVRRSFRGELVDQRLSIRFLVLDDQKRASLVLLLCVLLLIGTLIDLVICLNYSFCLNYSIGSCSDPLISAVSDFADSSSCSDFAWGTECRK